MLRKGDIKTKDVYMHIKANLLGDVVISAGRFEQKLSDVTVSMDLLKAAISPSRPLPTLVRH